jgi:hypothetical protein
MSNNVNSKSAQVRAAEITNGFIDRADKARMDATSFGVFGLRIPKGPFKDEGALKRIDQAQELANQIMQQLFDLLSTASRPAGSR